MYEKLLNEFTEVCKGIFKSNLVGVYLHGSLAIGCFNPYKSDIDLLVVVQSNISDEEKIAFMAETVNLNEEAPKKGLEVSIVKQSFCKTITYPTPYMLHFSPMHLNKYYESPRKYIKKMQGTDKDLVAHFMIVKKYGIVLFGKAIKDVFCDIPREYYLDSIWNDVKNALKKRSNDSIYKQPVYAILNLCRTLAYTKKGLVLSKETGGFWALTYMPNQYSSCISQALANYEDKQNLEFDERSLVELARDLLGQVSEEINKDKINLKVMTPKLYHKFFKGFINDPILDGTALHKNYVYDEDNVDLYIAKQMDLKRVCLAIMLKRRLIGEIIFKNIKPKSATISITMQRDVYKNKGYGTIAMKKALVYAFETMKLNKVYSDVLVKNLISQKLMDKTGFIQISFDKTFIYYQISRKDFIHD